jgi:hypothetical protein
MCQLDEALEHAEAHLWVVGRHPAADAVEDWLMMRLMFGQWRVCASAASFIQAREISSLGRTSTKSVRAATAILPTGWSSSSVRLFGSSSSPQYLSIFLVGASYAGRLR